MKKYKNNILKAAFTLLELIVVITILAILWTIAFLSFKDYTLDSRDANRISNVTNIKKWLEIFNVKKWIYPNPDWDITTWNINWSTIIASKWIIDTWVSRLINLTSIPKDPLTNDNYIYSLNSNKTEYQLSSIIEWSLTYNNPFINQANADNTWYISRVDWNYNWFTKYSSGCTMYTNIPSIIWSNSWSVDLLSEEVHYVVDKWTNLPYYPKWKENNISYDTPSEVISFFRQNPNAKIMSLCEEELEEDSLEQNPEKDIILSSFWVPDIPNLKVTILWQWSTPIYASCDWIEHWVSKVFYLESQVSDLNECSWVSFTCMNWIWETTENFNKQDYNYSTCSIYSWCVVWQSTIWQCSL